MTDVASVVAVLQQKPKGKLRYSSSSDNLDYDLPSSLNTSINVSPSLMYKTERRSSNKYLVYFSPERSIQQDDSFHSCNDETPKKKEKSPIRGISPPLRSSLEHTYFYTQSEKEKRKIDESFKEKLSVLSGERLEKMNYVFSEINEEYANSIEMINMRNLERTELAKDLLESHEASFVRRSDKELKDFQKLIEEKNEESHMRQNKIENIRNVYEQKKKASDLQKQLKRERCEKLQNYAESAKKIVMDASEIYKTYVNNNYENIHVMKSYMDDILNRYSQVIKYIREGLDNQKELETYIRESQTKIEHMKMIGEKIKAQLESVEQKIENEKKMIAKQLEEEQRRLEEEEKRKAEETKLKEQQEAKTKENLQATTNVTKPITNNTDTTAQNTAAINISISSIIPELATAEASLKPILSNFTSIPAFASYLKLRKMLSDTETNIAPLNKSTIKEKKTYKFDLYKVVNTCINAISDESPTHLLDKITKLNKLLTGAQVEMGSKSISANNEPCAILLCKDLLARKLVSQGVSQVSSSFKAAFPIAAVCVSLWSLHSDCGDLILAHFYKVCPLLVPFYLPKVKDLSTEQYFSFIGFDVTDGKIEEEDKFLKKLSGLVRLYAAIFCTVVPPQLGSRKHPHGLEFAWTWFTRLLNLDPLPVYTANILYDFLDVAGYFLMERYGKQFQKLLVYVCQAYVPKIIQVTPASSKASASRLRLFLENCIKTKKFESPEGYLGANWWRSI